MVDRIAARKKCASGQRKYQNPKSEIRKKSEARNPKPACQCETKNEVAGRRAIQQREETFNIQHSTFNIQHPTPNGQSDLRPARAVLLQSTTARTE